MTDMATALYVKKTGHVLGVVTRVGDPVGTLKADALAGKAFPVLDPATDDVLVEIEPTELDVMNAPLIDDLLLDPQSCYVDTGASKAFVESGTAPTASINANGVTVTLPANPPEKTAVWAQVESGSGSNRKRVVFSGDIDTTASSITFASSFASGEYDVLALVAGRVPKLQPDQTVP